MRTPSRNKRREQPAVMPMPSPEQMRKMGLIECSEQGCRVFIDPVNMPGGKCIEHARTSRPAPRVRGRAA